MKKTIFTLIIFLFSIVAFPQLLITDGTDLYVEPGTTLYVVTGINSDNATIWNFGTIDLKGSLENNSGSLFNTTSTGTFKFSGTTAQEITGDHDAGFYGITEIDNTSGLGLTATLTGADQTVNGELKFTSGKLTLNEFNLLLGAVEPTGFSADNYVLTNNSGELKRNVPADGVSMVFFPVGNSAFNPVYLQNSPTATTDTYGVRVEDQEPADLSTPDFVDRSWIITEEIPEGSGLTVILQWNGLEELTPFNRDLCAVGRVTGDGPVYDWKIFGAAMGDDPYYREGAEFTDAGTFTVGGNFPPVAVCQDVSVSADENCEGLVTAEQVDNGSYDPDGGPLTLSLDPPGPYSDGATVTLTVTDDLGASDQCTAIITVVDETPPVITTKPVEMEFVIWPPNHKYATFVLSDFVLSVDDNCADVSVDEVNITQATSDEPEDAEGEGDGNTLDDIVIAGDCKSIQLRKEREGEGNGRVYTIYLELDDGNGNTGSASCQVQVPHNKGETAIDDGPVYQVTGNCYNRSFAVAFENADNQGQLQVYPNPFEYSATISFTVPETRRTVLNVYDIRGMLVATLYDANAEAEQEYTFSFNGSALRNGIYTVSLQSGKDVRLIKKVLLNK